MSSLADRIESALIRGQNSAALGLNVPNLNAWPQPYVRREFAEWLAKEITTGSE